METATSISATPTQYGARRLTAIAGFAWLEAIRTRLPWMLIGVAILLLLMSVLVRSLTIAETTRIQVSFLAASTRIAAVFLICLHVLGSMLRENQDKGTELLMSLDLARWEYLGGKLLGYMIVATAICVVLWVPIAVIAPFDPALRWVVSLILESWIIVAASLFCVVTFNQLMLSASFVLMFYLLARAIAAILLVAQSSMLAPDSWGQQALTLSVKFVALILPGLHAFTDTAWLVNAAGDWSQFASFLVQTFIYCGLLFAAALFDLYRKNF